MLEKVPKYTLRKLSVGLASVMIGSGILMSSPKVLAATTSTSESTGTGTGTTSSEASSGSKLSDTADPRPLSTIGLDSEKNNANGNSTVDPNASSESKLNNTVNFKALSESKLSKPSSTIGLDSEKNNANGNSTVDPNASSESKLNNTVNFKALSESKLSKPSGAIRLEGVDSIVADKPSDGGKSTPSNNNPMIYENNADSKDQWLKTGTGELAQYLKVTGKDGKEYVTAYNNPQSQLVINYNLIDPNTFELVTVLKNGNKNANPLLITF